MKLSARIITVILALLMLTASFVFPASAKEISVSANGFDIPRESGALIIYTPAMGATTGTNEWGYEVIIKDNVAVEFNKGNSTIPANGFVLSGHDEEAGGKRMGIWIQENIELGDYVYYSTDGIVTVSDTPIAESIFYKLTNDIIGVNVNRDADSLVIYNTRGKPTATNEWGYEIICTNGIVTAMGGNNNTVPDEPHSFIVSGHGTTVSWLQENVKLGMSVSYDSVKKTVTFAYDEAAVIAGMDMLAPALWDKYDAAMARYDYFNYASAKAAIEELENLVASAKRDFDNSKDANALSTARNEADTMANDIALLLSESRTVEYRGVWIRPVETSAAQVEETVQKLYDNGINMICIETLYDSTMIMPMPEDSLFKTNPKFKHFDMLQAYIDACHERGMELHLWMPIYYVGDADSANAKYSLGTEKPEWLSVSNTGKYSHQVVEGSGLMLIDPSNEEASNYLLNTYKYILEKYDVDGFQLDYIRYYVRGTDYDMGYTKEALDAFEEKYGVRPTYNVTASYWNDWVAFRCEYINSFVQRIRKLIDDVRPGVLLGADVVPDPTESIDYNYQNYYTWLENKWIDILFPMSYGYGYEDAIADQTERCGEHSFIAVGLGIFMGELNAASMQEQTSYNTSVNADGSVYFEATSYLKKETGAHLKKGAYRNSAVTPTFDKLAAAKAQLEYAKGRINDILIPLGGITENGGATVIKAIDDFAATVTADGYDSAKYAAVTDAISKSGAEEKAAERMLADINYAVKVYSVTNKEIDLSGVPELPENPDFSDNSEISEPGSDSEKSEGSADTSETDTDTDEGGSDITVIVIIVIAAVIVVACVVYFGLIKKGKK